MSRMHISETIRFAVRHILPPMLVVLLIFLVTIIIFPTFSLTFGEFTLVYWILGIVVLPLNYKTMKWTKYVIEHYGLEMEKNPVMRDIYATKNFKKYQTNLIALYVSLIVFYVIGINIQVFLIIPSWIAAIVLYDFLNDFYWLRRLKINPETKL